MNENRSIPDANDADRATLEHTISVLQAQNAALERSVRNLEERMIRCPLTGLYNEDFFQEYMRGAVDVTLEMSADGALLFISIDDLSDINIRFGSAVADETIKKFAVFLPALAPAEAIFFRLNGALFACYVAALSPEMGAALAERIRFGVESAEIFADRATVSIGVVALSELREQGGDDRKALVGLILNRAKARLGLARRMGSNAVCGSGADEADEGAQAKVILADADAFRRSLVAEMLKARGYSVHEASTGVDALEAAARMETALVVCDLALPGLDAVSLRGRMRESTELARIPFLMIVDRKNAELATRAYALGVSVILQRPILIAEFYGLVHNLIERSDADAQ